MSSGTKDTLACNVIEVPVYIFMEFFYLNKETSKRLIIWSTIADSALQKLMSIL